MIITLKPYDASTMEYTHYENIQGMCMTRAAYFACFSGGADFPTAPPALAELAVKMIKTGFVIHREFESCFEMGNGGEVMKLLVDMALKDDALRDWWQRGAYYIGDFEKVKQRFYPEEREVLGCNM